MLKVLRGLRSLVPAPSGSMKTVHGFLAPRLHSYAALLLLIVLTLCVGNAIGTIQEFNLPSANSPVSSSLLESASGGETLLRRPPLWKELRIRLDPPYLDFKDQPVGMPKIETVVIHNLNERQSLHLNSISGSTLHFHSSFFEATIVPPGEKTTFQVVFLARMVGNAENSLFIHTSQGIIPYQVFGSGLANPYRLRPFLGARVPVNSSYSPVINMHNPHSSTLQVLEMYTSNGDLHLELPSGEEEGLKQLWEIPPYETKAVMRANFIGRVINNHTAFIRIKTNIEKEKKTSMLILPVEIEVTGDGGLFSNLDTFDFGTLRTIDEPKTLQLQLLSTISGHSIYVNELRIEPPNEAIEIHFEPMQLTKTQAPIPVARIAFDPSKANPRRQQNGHVIAITTDKKQRRLQFPYQARVLHGGLYATASQTAFLLKPPPFVPVRHDIELTSSFNVPLTIYRAEFPPTVAALFEVVGFSQPRIVYPGQATSPVSVSFTQNSSDREIDTVLRLFTNASVFTVPIHAYNGKLKYSVDGSNESVLDFGAVSSTEPKEMILRVMNKNPVEVTINDYSCALNFIQISFLGVRPSIRDGRDLPGSNRGKAPEKLKSPNISIPSGFTAVFEVKLNPPSKDESHSSSVVIKTPNTVLSVRLKFKTIFGVVEAQPKKFKFRNCFPGRVEAKSLFLESTYSKLLKVTSIEPRPADARFVFSPQNKSSTTLKPGVKTKVGWLKFDPFLGKKEPYLGLSAKKMSRPEQWTSRLTLDSHVSLADSRDHEILFQLWEDLKQTNIETVFHVDVDFGTGALISAQAALIWPSVVPDDPIRFPLTHIGNTSVHRMRVDNPSDQPLVVQVLMLACYPNPESALDLLSERIGTDSFIMNTDDKDVFRVVGTKIVHSSGLIPPSSYVLPLHKELKVQVSEAAQTLLLKPRSHEYVELAFTPKSPKTETTLVLLRNNLTIMDAVIVQGQGVLSMFTLDGREPGKSHTPLQFNLTAVFLAKCNDSGHHNFTMKRTFTAKNSGQLPIHVQRMEISGKPCEGYGFLIKNCESFVLYPNRTRKINIDFTPDFKLSRIQRELHIVTAEGLRLDFHVVASLPHHLLSLYMAASPRPDWEPLLIRSLFFSMLAVVVGVLWQAYVSGSKYVAAIPRFGNEINEKFAQVSGKKFDLKEAEKPVGKEKEKEDAQLRRTPLRAVEELGVKESSIETPSDVRAISKESSSVEELKEAPVADVKEKKEISTSVEEPPPPPKDSSRLKRKPATKSAPSVDTTTVINPPEKDSIENDDKDAKFDTPAPDDEMSSKDEFQDAINDEEILAGRVPRNDDETATKTARATNAGGRLSPIAKPTRGDNSDACSKAELDGHGSSTDDLLNDDSIVKVITATGGDSCETTAGGECPKRDDTTTTSTRKAKPSDKKEAKGTTAGGKQHKGSKGSQAKAPLRDPHVIANTIAASLAQSKRSRPADSDSADQPGWNKTKDGAKSASTAPPPLDTTTTTTSKSRSVEAKSKKSSSSTKLSPTKQSKTTATKRKDDRRSRKGEKAADAAAADAAAASPKPSIERFQRFLANQKPEFKPRSTRVGSDTKEPSDKGDVSSSENGSVSSPTELDVSQPLFSTTGPAGAASSPPQPPKRANDDSHSLNRRLGPLDDLPGLPSPDDPELASIDPLSLAFPGDSPAMFSFLAQQSRRQSRGGSGGGGGGGGGNRYNDQVQSPSSPNFDLMSGGDLPYDPLLDNRAVLSRMNYLRRQTSGPDPFLDIDTPVPPVPSSSRPSLRSPSPPLDDDDGGGGGDGDVPLFHHGSRVFPRRMRNTIWAQRVGRSGRGLVSRPLVDDDPFDGLPPLDVGRRFPYRSHSGPYDWLESDFAGTGAGTGGGGGGDDHWDLDGGFQPDSDRDRYELLRRQRQQQQLLQATRRARERDPDDVLFGRRRGSSPPPLLNEYYQRSVMARMDSGGGSRGDRSAWTAALQKHRREQTMALGYSTSVSENLLSRPAFPRSSTLDSDLGSPFWDASTLQADSPQERNWNSVWPTANKSGSTVSPVGAIGDDLNVMGDAKNSTKATPSFDDETGNVDSTSFSPPPSLPTSSAYNPFGSTNIWEPPPLGTSGGGPWIQPSGGQKSAKFD